MWGNVWRATIVVAVISSAGVTPALAADGSYVPDTPPGGGLGGSVVQSMCIGQAPTIGYTIVRTAPSASGAATTQVRTVETASFSTVATASSSAAASPPNAELVISGSGEQVAVPLQVDASGAGSGTVLWPGVETSADGTEIGRAHV